MFYNAADKMITKGKIVLAFFETGTWLLSYKLHLYLIFLPYKLRVQFADKFLKEKW